MKKQYLGTLLEFKLKKKKQTYKGILVNYSKEWTLLINNPVDFVIDGFTLINNNKILGYQEYKKSLEQKILSKKINSIKPLGLNLENTQGLISDFLSKNITFSIEKSSSDSFAIGKVKSMDKNNSIVFKPLNPDATWAKIEKLSIDDIAVIEYNTDYINSLLLVAK